MQKLLVKLFIIQVRYHHHDDTMPNKKKARKSKISIYFIDETYLATVSVTKPLKGYPVIDKFQVADSEWNTTSTGDINFYLQKNNPVFANIKKKNEVSAMFSNETRLYNNETEQWEPTGHRVFITGFVAQVCLKRNFILSPLFAINFIGLRFHRIQLKVIKLKQLL